MWEWFHVEWEPQPLHDGIIWHPAVIYDWFQMPFQIRSHTCGGNIMMGASYLHPLYIKFVNGC